MKKRVHEYLFISSDDDFKCKVFQSCLMTLIALNVVVVILETVEHFANQWGPFFYWFELFSVVVFSIEYVLRLWSCTADEKYGRSPFGIVRYVVSPLAIVDLLAIMPFYLPLLITFDLRVLRILRLVRVFRLFKVGRYSKSLQILIRVLKAKKEEIFVTLFVGFILLVLSSSLVFFCEHEAQPEAFSNIPEAIWWGVITLTTVGYGDVYPITVAGKILGSLIAILGIGMFALPAGILGSGFVEEIQKRKVPCPHCGKMR